MSEPTATARDVKADQPEEWKPEPRQWSWKDIFTAPMLAFKPKCMLISAVTIVALALWSKAYYALNPGGMAPAAAHALGFIWLAVGLVVFSVAGTLVAVFMKADLLDDEFLSLGEAIGQYKSRILPAVLVPCFLMALLAGFLVLIAVPSLIASIPVVGPTLWAVFYPLGYVLGLFVTLLAIAVALSVFVLPSIIAIRKHGWFDNVVDTFEAVGTKPHVLVGSLFLVGVLMYVSSYIGFGGMQQLDEMAQRMPGGANSGLLQTEGKANAVSNSIFSHVRSGPLAWLPMYSGYGRDTTEGYYAFTGTVTGMWQILIGAFILGYCMNLFIGGGMLTYLVVREDDYWDDEDLEDLDKLAKELEEEAKQDAKDGTAPAAAPAAASAPAPAAPAASAPSAPSESPAAAVAAAPPLVTPAPPTPPPAG